MTYGGEKVIDRIRFLSKRGLSLEPREKAALALEPQGRGALHSQLKATLGAGLRKVGRLLWWLRQ